MRLLLCSLGLCFVAAAGCTSPCVIDSSPQGALIRVDGADLGQTPVVLTCDRGRGDFGGTYTVEAFKPGYEKQVQTLAARYDWWTGSAAWPSAVIFHLVKTQNAGMADSAATKP